jgi:hypothetical protein
MGDTRSLQCAQKFNTVIITEFRIAYQHDVALVAGLEPF